MPKLKWVLRFSILSSETQTLFCKDSITYEALRKCIYAAEFSESYNAGIVIVDRTNHSRKGNKANLTKREVEKAKALGFDIEGWRIPSRMRKRDASLWWSKRIFHDFGARGTGGKHPFFTASMFETFLKHPEEKEEKACICLVGIALGCPTHDKK